MLAELILINAVSRHDLGVFDAQCETSDRLPGLTEARGSSIFSVAIDEFLLTRVKWD
jgi:hypothetical protein